MSAAEAPSGALGCGQRAADGGQTGAVGSEEGEVDAHVAHHALERRLLLGGRGGRRRQHVARDERQVAALAGLGHAVPEHGRGDGEHREAREHGKVDAHVQPAHVSSAAWRTRSPRRAR